VPELRFEVNVDALRGVGNLTKAQAMPRLADAVAVVAGEAKRMWQDAIVGAHLWEVEKKAYVDSLKVNILGPLEAEVVSDYRLALEIEKGRPAKDLKAMLPTAKKSRVVGSGPHKGQKYLIIPFQHNVPDGTTKRGLAPKMPVDIYAAAKQLTASRLLPVGSVKPAMRRSGSGFLVQQDSYSWGGRLPAGMAPKLKSTHKTDPYAGIIRFGASTSKSKRSSYLTFRVMGEWSDGWVVAPRPGLDLVKGVYGHLEPILREAVERAVGKS